MKDHVFSNFVYSREFKLKGDYYWGRSWWYMHSFAHIFRAFMVSINEKAENSSKWYYSKAYIITPNEAYKETDIFKELVFSVRQVIYLG